MEPKPEPSSRVKQSNTSPQYQHKQIYHAPQRNTIPQQLPSMDSSGNPLRNIQLKRTPKKRDPFLDVDPRDDRRAERLNVQLRKTTGKQRGTGIDEMVELKATLKDVMKTLKPVPRRRQVGVSLSHRAAATPVAGRAQCALTKVARYTVCFLRHIGAAGFRVGCVLC
ncbi:unnamed protein product [Oncorhynchus mykiss]|uniref:Uncharacterized protein n=1 Tax=Oncorhynchus mykiss TaxID=8022 RepID=A0A060XG52_ONCMY|nr:unnamed protein product [Oncorhynchus mykiss]